jgi:hypothetical protein
LRLGKKILHSLRQQMRRRMANDFEAFRITVGDNPEVAIRIDAGRGIDQLVVDLACKRRARETAADIGSDLGDSDWLGVLPTAAVRERNDWHFRS